MTLQRNPPGHFILKCSEHNMVIRQCRCPGPKLLKYVSCPMPLEHVGKAR